MTMDGLTQEDRKKEAAKERFDQWREYLHLAGWGHGQPAFKRLQEARYAIRDWRYVSNTRGSDSEEIELAVRVVADTFANQIQAAGAEQDAATIAWVVAGLRCPSRPFCTGCTSCQTVTSPLRPADRVRDIWS